MSRDPIRFYSFFFHDPATTEIYTLSLHDALPISLRFRWTAMALFCLLYLALIGSALTFVLLRSEEHTSELQSRFDLVCRLLLEKKKLRSLTIAPSPSRHCDRYPPLSFVRRCLSLP